VDLVSQSVNHLVSYLISATADLLFSVYVLFHSIVGFSYYVELLVEWQANNKFGSSRDVLKNLPANFLG
jgi:hypothetical protein